MQQHEQVNLTRRAFLAVTLAAAACRQLWQDVLAAAPENDIPRPVLGKTGEKVSIVGLGGYRMGNSLVTGRLGEWSLTE